MKRIKKTPNIYLNDQLSYAEVEKAVRKLQNGKSPGLDNIPNEILKNKEVIMCLWYLYRKCFLTGVVPSIWLDAIISPIPKSKSNDPCVPLNHRGVSLLCTISKLYSYSINNRLLRYFDTINLFSDFQNGFRQKRSCEDHAFVLSSVLRNRMLEQKSTYISFIDFEKAFDWIDRDMLMYKLISYNVDGKFYKAIRAMYNNTRAIVKVNQMFSSWFDT